MFVGGSPGSTAGGIKTTSAALLGLLAFSRFRGRNTTDLWGRTIPEVTIQRAVGLSVASFALVTFCILVLTTIEGGGGRSPVRDSFLKYMFEAVSAYNTVGLSMGVTAALSAMSKLTLVLLMFLGRVGLATAAAALVLARPDPTGEFRYAYEDVVVG
jgi:trk system potassium uptake protein TrkH